MEAVEDGTELNLIAAKELNEESGTLNRVGKTQVEPKIEMKLSAQKDAEEEDRSDCKIGKAKKKKMHCINDDKPRRPEVVMGNVGKGKKHRQHNKLHRAELEEEVQGKCKQKQSNDQGSNYNKAEKNADVELKGKDQKAKQKQSKDQGSNYEHVEKEADVELRKEQNGKQAARNTRSMFADGFEERHDLEQYFWSETTVMQLTEALKPTTWHTEHGHVCCLTVPSLAHAFYAKEGRIEALLDIDTRFNYLPGFRFFDLCNPLASEYADDFRIVVFDPPFFYIPLPVLFQAVLVAAHGNLQAKLLVGFLRREEGAFLQAFAPFRLRRTRFVLEYAAVKPNKWRNYALYANVDLPGIKRIT